MPEVTTENAPDLLSEFGEATTPGLFAALESPDPPPKTDTEREDLTEEAVESPGIEEPEAETVESPLEEPAEEAPAEEEAPGEPQDGAYDELVARLIEAEATAENAEAVLVNREHPTIDPDSVALDITDEEFEQMMTNKDAAIAILKRSTATTVNHVLANLAPIIHQQVGERIVNYELLRQFFAEYPIFQRNPKAAEAAIMKVKRSHPEAEGGQVVDLVRKEVEERFKQYKEIEKSVGRGKKVDIRPRGSRFAPGTNARGKVTPQKPPDPRAAAQKELERALSGRKNTLLDDFEEV